MNHRKKTKADGSRLIPRKHTETLVLLSITVNLTPVQGKFHIGKKLSLQESNEESNQLIGIQDADFRFFQKFLVFNPNFQ